MEQITTYNQVIKIFELIAQQHKQLNSCFIGRNWELGAENANIKFPVLQVKPSTARLIKNSSDKRYNCAEFSISIRVLDLLQKEELNKTDVYSDTFQIIQDIVALISTHPYFKNKFCEITNNTVEAIAEEELTTLNAAGWSTVLQIKVLNWGGYCGIPIDWSTDIF